MEETAELTAAAAEEAPPDIQTRIPPLSAGMEETAELTAAAVEQVILQTKLQRLRAPLVDLAELMGGMAASAITTATMQQKAQTGSL